LNDAKLQMLFAVRLGEYCVLCAVVPSVSPGVSEDEIAFFTPLSDERAKIGTPVKWLRSSTLYCPYGGQD
jgi:hypothetical protein